MRAEHAVDFAKGKPISAASARRTADAEVASSAGVDGMLPSVGDVIAVRDLGHDMGVILRVLPRRTSFERWRGKNRGERQVLAANVDVIFIVQPLGAERDALPLMRDRVARSLVLARDCGADPVVVLTKVDRCEPAEVADVCGALRRLAGTGVRVIATSSLTGEGLDEVRSCIPQGRGMILASPVRVSQRC
ncbi:MAG: GTPase RsgA [Collinsella intestinalis]